MSDGLIDDPLVGGLRPAVPRLRAVGADERFTPEVVIDLQGHSNPRIRVRLFGSLHVEGDGFSLTPKDFGGLKAKQLFQLLLLSRGAPVPKARLAENLWTGTAPRNVCATLEPYVSQLRRRLGHDVIVTEHEAYRVATDLVVSDLERFDRLIVCAHEAAPDPATALSLLAEALALVTGELLADEPYAEWVLPHRRVLEGRVIDAHVDAATLAVETGQFRLALEYANSAAPMAPTDERLVRLIMIAMYGVGRQCDALATFERFRATLISELGVEPTKATADLHVRILQQEPIQKLRGGSSQITLFESSAVTLEPSAVHTLLASLSLAKKQLGRGGVSAVLHVAEIISRARVNDSAAMAELDELATSVGAGQVLRSLLADDKASDGSFSDGHTTKRFLTGSPKERLSY